MSTPIIVLAGQSNANRVEIQQTIATYAAASGALFVNYGVSGTPLSTTLDKGAGDWSGSTEPGAGELRMDLEARIDAILDPASPFYVADAYVATVIWIQGEGDLKSADTAEAYAGNLIELRDYFTDKYGTHEWVVSALSADSWVGRTESEKGEALWMTVHDAQLALDAMDGFTVVDPDAVAADNGIAVADMFDADRVHYALDFQPLLANALVNTLDIDPGQINLLVGTSAMDRIYVPESMFSQVYGAAGSDVADFSGLSYGINVDATSAFFVDVAGRHGDKLFGATLVEVEQIQGTDYDDYMVTGGRTTRVMTGAGNDTVIGSEDRNVIFLDDGNDRAFGKDGDDFIRGRDGDDLLKGDAGNDTLHGDDGNDNIQGGSGDDFIFGGRGDDLVNPHNGADTIGYGRGDNGSDRINGFDDREDVLSFTGQGLDYDSFVFDTAGRDLHIVVSGDRFDADIVLLNRANIAPLAFDASVDWIVL